MTLPFYFGRLKMSDIVETPTGNYVKDEALIRISKEIAAEKEAAKMPFKPLR